MTRRAQQRRAWRTSLRSQRAAARGGIHLHVAELEFRGVGRSTANRITAAFEAEMASLLARDGVPHHWNGAEAIPRLQGSIAKQRTDAGRGEALARAVLDSQREPHP